MKTFFRLILVALNCSLCGAADLPRSRPEEQGVSSANVLDFIEAADKDIHSLNSVMFVRHGHVVAEGWWTPYNAESRHSLYSLSKSFTSTAVGMAIAEGKFTLDDEVLKFFPDDAPQDSSQNLKSMRVSDLLRMSTGQDSEPPRRSDTPWVKSFLAHPVPSKPGTRFVYNTSATYMLSAIVQQATGQVLLDYLKPRLFDPLGIDNPTWEISPQGVSTGGYGLSVRTEDIAKFGQMYLQKGNWQGKQLVTANWIDAATARQTSNGSNPKSDWDQGYGYQFWRCRNGAYRGDGAFGQYCIVLPEQDAVIAITSGLGDMQAVLNLIWDKLLPSLKPAALPADEATNQKLMATLKGLKIPPQQGSATPSKPLAKKYVFADNDRKLQSVALITDQPESVTLVTQVAGKEQRFVCGRNAWQTGRGSWEVQSERPAGVSGVQGTEVEQPLAASGAWTADDTFQGKLCFYETPFTITVTLKFSENEVRFDQESNVGFRPAKESQLIGKVE